MVFQIDLTEDAAGKWVVAKGVSDLTVDGDPLVDAIVAMVRDSYGEQRLKEQAETLLEAEIADGAFSTEHLIAGIRLGFPDPAAEGKKPVALRNSRSEAAEFVAKSVLKQSCGVSYPAAAQMAKQNANQPVLGFDGWGILDEAGNVSLVLIQVKGTDEPDRPPSMAEKLVKECIQCPRDTSAVSRALCSLSVLCVDEDVKKHVFWMLAKLGKGEGPVTIVVPVVVRGLVQADHGDLQLFKNVSHNFRPCRAIGVSVSIGSDLANFGQRVMTLARSGP